MRRRTARGALLLTAFCGTAIAQGQELHFEPEQKGVGLWDALPDGQLYEDVDGDGWTDLVALLQGFPIHVRLVRGTPDGTFAWSGIPLELPGALFHLLADLDGDGRADWIHASVGGGNNVAVQFGNGQPGSWWNPAVTYPAASDPNEAAVGDLNDDGYLDVVVSGGWSGPGWVQTRLNDGAGGLVFADWESAGYRATGVDCGEINGDGWTDVVVHDVTSQLYFLAGEGDGGLREAVPLWGGGWSTLRTVDVDADGLDEIVTGSGTLVVGEFEHGAGFLPPYTITSELASDWRLADMNGDGFVDVLGVREDGARGISLGDGTGVFGTAYPLPVPDASGTPVDLDGDGLLDLADLTGENNESIIQFNRSLPSPWTEIPGGTSGFSGTPRLEAHGVLLAGAWTHVGVDNAHPQAPALVVVGRSTVHLPLYGGVLIPAPELLVPVFTTGHGSADLEWGWPEGTPAGTTLYYQAWILDPFAPTGWASSNGMSGTTQ